MKKVKFTTELEIVKKVFAIVLIAGFVFALSACNNDDDDVEEVVHYTLAVKNASAHEAQIFMSSNLQGSGFVSKGTVQSGNTIEIKELIVDVEYKLRAVETGKSVDDYFDEHTVKYSDKGTYNLTVNN